MKSTAPAFIASTARGTSPWPVMTIAGRPMRRVLSCRCSSSPSISGILTSVTMQPGWTVGKASRNAGADSYTLTAKPDVVSRKATAWRTASSSSIRCTTASRAIGGVLPAVDFLPAQGLERQAEDGAAIRIGFRPQPPAMGLDDGARDRQADPHAVRLAGDERLEQLRLDFRGNAGAGVDHADLGHVVVALCGGNRQFADGCFLHCLDRVADQVQD